MRAPEEQTALITGATDGLGRALASALAAAGVTVLVHGRDETRGRQTIGELEAATGNGKLRWLRADFASLDEVRGLASNVSADCDRLDVLVNNAGIGTTLPLPPLCEDVRSWKATGFQTMPPRTASLAARIDAIEPTPVPSRLLAPFERGTDAGVLARTKALETTIAESEFILGQADWIHVLETLGLQE